MSTVSGPDEKQIRLIPRGDDLGQTHAFNVAAIKACNEGILRSLTVLVPGPWFLEAVALLNANPHIDVGVELCLNSEWANCKYRPLTHGPTISDENGYLHRTMKPYKRGAVDPGEVEQELRAQIELIRKHIPRVTHLCCHMGTATCTDELTAVVNRLSTEYGLPRELDEPVGHIRMWSVPADEKKKHVLDTLEALEPGIHMFDCHPAFDVPETRAMKGDERDASARMAVHRQIITEIMTSAEIKELVERRGIRLLSFGDALAEDKVGSRKSEVGS